MKQKYFDIKILSQQISELRAEIKILKSQQSLLVINQ